MLTFAVEFLDGRRANLEFESESVIGSVLQARIRDQFNLQNDQFRAIISNRPISPTENYTENANVYIVNTAPTPLNENQAQSARATENTPTEPQNAANNNRRPPTHDQLPDQPEIAVMQTMVVDLNSDMNPSLNQNNGTNGYENTMNRLVTEMISQLNSNERNADVQAGAAPSQETIRRAMRSFDHLIRNLRSDISRGLQVNSIAAQQNANRQNNLNQRQPIATNEQIQRFITMFGDLSILISRVSTLSQEFYQRITRINSNSPFLTNSPMLEYSESILSTFHTLAHALHNISNFQLSSANNRLDIQVSTREDHMNNIIDRQARVISDNVRDIELNNVSLNDLPQVAIVARTDRNLPCNSRHFVEGVQQPPRDAQASNARTNANQNARVQNTVPNAPGLSAIPIRRTSISDRATVALQGQAVMQRPRISQQRQEQSHETFNFIVRSLLDHSHTGTTYIHDALNLHNPHILFTPFRRRNFSDSYIIRLFCGYYDMNVQSIRDVLQVYYEIFDLANSNERTMREMATQYANNRFRNLATEQSFIDTLTNLFEAVHRPNYDNPAQLIGTIRTALIASIPSRLFVPVSHFGFDVLKFLVTNLYNDSRSRQEVFDIFSRSILYQNEPIPSLNSEHANYSDHENDDEGEDSTETSVHHITHEAESETRTNDQFVEASNSPERDQASQSNPGRASNQQNAGPVMDIFSNIVNQLGAPRNPGTIRPGINPNQTHEIDQDTRAQMAKDKSELEEHQRKHCGSKNFPKSAAYQSLKNSAKRKKDTCFDQESDKSPVNQLVSKVISENTRAELSDSNEKQLDAKEIAESENLNEMIKNAVKSRAKIDPNYDSSKYKNIESLIL